jgi:3-hydroxyisobutyrate dehydrogenase-like beta-hydroxyacid dehydrogenase
MTDKMRVGLIGAGLMGHGIGKNIVEKGFPLTVMAHRNREPVDDLIKRGAKEAKSPKEIAEASDLVILCVTATPQVEETVYGANGIIHALRKDLIVADASTAEPQSTVKIAGDFAAKGAWFLDIPLTRTPKEAEEGRLGLMVGGDKKILAKIDPVLRCFAEAIVYSGDVGAAHKLKLINNYIALGTAAIVAEGITAAAKAGVDMQALRDIVVSGGANSVMFERLIKVPLADDDTAAKFAIRNARKDLRYYTNMAEQLPVTAFCAEAVHQTFVMAETQGYSERYVPRLIDMLAGINGIKK